MLLIDSSSWSLSALNGVREAKYSQNKERDTEETSNFAKAQIWFLKRDSNEGKRFYFRLLI